MATVVEGFLVVMGRIVEVFFTARYVGESFVDACRYLSYDGRWVAGSCVDIQWCVVGFLVWFVVFCL